MLQKYKVKNSFFFYIYNNHLITFLFYTDSYVKVTYSVLSKTHKVKKTSVHKASKEPLYNQTFEFKIDQQGMEVACFNFEVKYTSF